MTGICSYVNKAGNWRDTDITEDHARQIITDQKKLIAEMIEVEITVAISLSEKKTGIRVQSDLRKNISQKQLRFRTKRDFVVYVTQNLNMFLCARLKHEE